MIRFAGPLFANVDNRLMALQLVEQDLTEAAMFTADGETVQWNDALYRKPVLVQRGSFRPVTNTTVDVLECALEQFLQEPDLKNEAPVVLMEMTLRHLTWATRLITGIFSTEWTRSARWARPVLISNFLRYHRLVTYLSRYTQKTIGLPLGLVRWRDIMDERFYTELAGRPVGIVWPIVPERRQALRYRRSIAPGRLQRLKTWRSNKI